MTECSRCGDCCENIYVGRSISEITAVSYLPEGPSTWVKWNENIESCRFIMAKWVPYEIKDNHARFQCTMFNKETRLCTAHDDRPPICSGYPWYGGGPVKDPGRLPARCSFNADTRKNLPIVRITNGTAK